ncbi:MAG: hypothetical protein OQK94_07670 [Gammaproteobacteria bacterium]|nr:hypothetical protein [Gammaproteobacteria bacterium]MCW8840228.1 hypothetical protein [Gammaproteobacteria bacterium]MCW8958768.1 hypothetical protein [Gammaproteobacteria bacterium]MCW8973179.1 hypothetical protein [Gammaproteobacteria bacterium]MCW8991927.1 hypothetical protein [Gammaproteobacteria bacterium]
MSIIKTLTMDITNIGLTLDILGAMLIFIFGVPKQPFFSRHDQVVVTNRDKSAALEKLLSILWRSLEYLGVSFLIIGFSLQIVGRS